MTNQTTTTTTTPATTSTREWRCLTCGIATDGPAPGGLCAVCARRRSRLGTDQFNKVWRRGPRGKAATTKPKAKPQPHPRADAKPNAQPQPRTRTQSQPVRASGNRTSHTRHRDRRGRTGTGCPPVH